MMVSNLPNLDYSYHKGVAIWCPHANFSISQSQFMMKECILVPTPEAALIWFPILDVWMNTSCSESTAWLMVLLSKNGTSSG